MTLLLLDNYDSFVHNLARYFRQLGQPTCVVRNDAIDVAGVRAMRPAALILSPGPCTPDQAGSSLRLVRELYGELPMLGVCLGHQVIAAAMGAEVVCAARPVHGETSAVHHDGSGLFDGLPSPLTGCRYHSLVVEPTSLPETLRATAWTDGGVLMAFEHVDLPIYGVQFHPESILTERGYELLANFLRLAGLEASSDPIQLGAGELPAPRDDGRPLPTQPVTF